MFNQGIPVSQFTSALNQGAASQALVQLLSRRLKQSFERRGCQSYTDTGKVIDQWLAHFRLHMPEVAIHEEMLELAMQDVEKDYICSQCR